MRPGPKRRRFRNPTCMAALVLAVGLTFFFLVANLLWTAAAGSQAPSLLGVVCYSQSFTMHLCLPACAWVKSPDSGATVWTPARVGSTG